MGESKKPVVFVVGLKVLLGFSGLHIVRGFTVLSFVALLFCCFVGGVPFCVSLEF